MIGGDDTVGRFVSTAVVVPAVVVIIVTVGGIAVVGSVADAVVVGGAAVDALFNPPRPAFSDLATLIVRKNLATIHFFAEVDYEATAPPSPPTLDFGRCDCVVLEHRTAEGR